MAADETSICNLSLALLGQSAIMSLSDASQAARFCHRFYEPTRDEVTQAHAWNFAIKRTSLARLSEAPGSEWAHQYQLPTDCLRMLELNGFSSTEREGLYEIEGRKLLTDADAAHVRYVAQIQDANLFPPLFVEALSVKLASRLAQPLTGSRSAQTDLMTEYERITGPKARRMNAVENRPQRKEPWVESDLVRARF